MVLASDPIFSHGGNGLEHFWIFASGFFGGATGLSVLAQAINTFPVPDSKWGKWVLGIAQAWIGQKERAANTRQGFNTVTLATVRQNDTGEEGAK